MESLTPILALIENLCEKAKIPLGYKIKLVETARSEYLKYLKSKNETSK